MRTDFENIRFPAKVVGAGEPGAKTRMLDLREPLILAAGFQPFPRTSFTGEFFRAFLERSGVDKIPPADFDAKQKAIQEAKFTEEEKKVFWDMAGPLAGFFAYLRSDEASAAGTGIFTSTHLRVTGTKDEILGKFIAGIKEVLASNFSPWADSFKTRIGLASEMGVMVCPFLNKLAWAHKEHGDWYDPTIELVGFSSYFGDEPLFSRRVLKFEESDTMEHAVATAITNNSVNPSDDLEYHELSSVYFGHNAVRSRARARLQELHKAIRALQSDGVPKYFELIASDIGPWATGDGRFPFYTVQINDFAAPYVAIPDDAKKNALATAMNVIGSGIKKTDKIAVISEFSDIKKLREIPDGGRIAVIADDIRLNSSPQLLHYYHNVDLILISSHPRRFTSKLYFLTYLMSTHCSGSFREAGIATLFVPPDEFENLKTRACGEKVLDYPLTTYANELGQEGYICSR